MFSKKPAKSLKISALVACQVPAMLLSFIQESRVRLIYIRHISLTLFPVDTGKSEATRDADSGSPLESVYKYYLSIVLDAENSLQ